MPGVIRDPFCPVRLGRQRRSDRRRSNGADLQDFRGAGTVTTAEGALLTLNNSADTEFSGVLSGAGSLKKTGTGTLTLSQTPAYTGTTAIDAGTLILGSGGTLYDLSGGCADTDPAVFANLDASGQRLTLVNSENTSFTGSITASEIEKTARALFC